MTTAVAVAFDGTNDYLTRGGNLTGIANSSTGILSAWVNFANTPVGGLNIFANDLFTANLAINVNGDDKIAIDIAESTFTDYLLLMTTAGVPSPTGWVHILSSWDVNAAAGLRTAHLYITDTDGLTIATDTGSAFAAELATASEWVVGVDPSLSQKAAFDLAELYYAPGEYLDFSVEANRRLFISAAGEPVDLGADGSTPTGSQPLVYLSIRDAQAASEFATNRGTGGNFTVNGELATATFMDFEDSAPAAVMRRLQPLRLGIGIGL
jgi:hypothetical protein